MKSEGQRTGKSKGMCQENYRRSPHLALAPWLPPAASLDRTWVEQSQPNLEHSHSSKLLSPEK